MDRKTKSELLEEIEQKNDEINALHKQIEDLEKRKEYEKMANEIKGLEESFVIAGFSEEEAFSLTQSLCSAAISNRRII